jgi:hypothetical protein
LWLFIGLFTLHELARSQQPLPAGDTQKQIAELERQIAELQKKLDALRKASAARPSVTLETVIQKLTWRCIGPANMGGRITAIAVVESDPTTYYVATASGGLIKTTNNGTTFTHLFDRENTVSIGDVAVAPSNPNIVWVGTGEANPRNSVSYGDGVYKSTDGGKTWSHMGLKHSFQIGKIQVLLDGKDGVIFATGHMVWHALQASYALEEKGLSIAVINVHTLKPLDKEGIAAWLERSPIIVTAEEHQIHNGLGDAISHVATEYCPRCIHRIAVQDTFGESGKPDELLEKYGLNTRHIIAAIEKVLHTLK